MLTRKQIFKRKLLCIYGILICTQALRGNLPHRSCYVRRVNLSRRTLGEYHGLIQEFRKYDPERFFQQFRMDKDTFDRLVLMVSPNIQKAKTHRLPISPAERIAITLR